jgi:hypothetical protein
MNEQIKAGADIHAGDGGYSEGTQEQYDAFVKVRNKSLAQGRIKELAEQAGSTHKQSLGVYQFYTDELEKFAELIAGECADIAREYDAPKLSGPGLNIASRIEEQFGVDE